MMAESESVDCPCSNITIMQLFHELKQRYPTVPDQIVSEVIQENFHDKSACETILRKENHNYLQSYPGALISGNPREPVERGPLCNHCPVSRQQQQQQEEHRHREQEQTSQGGDVTHPPPQCTMPNNLTQVLETSSKRESAFPNSSDNSICFDEIGDNDDEEMVSNKCGSVHSPKSEITPKITRPNSLDERLLKLPIGQLIKEARSVHQQKIEKSKSNSIKNTHLNELVLPDLNVKTLINVSEEKCESSTEPDDSTTAICATVTSTNATATTSTVTSTTATATTTETDEKSAVINDRTRKPDDEGADKVETLERSHSCVVPTSQNDVGTKESRRWSVEDGGSAVVSGVVSRPGASGPTPLHNYQVAVQYMMQPIPVITQSGASGEQPRSFTSVNLCLRPPSSEPQPPIEIQSGQSLTYTTTSFDPKQGFQSQLQIRIGPGGGGTVSACRTYVSSPQMRFSSSSSSSSKSPCCTPQLSAPHRCHNRQHIRALLEKQRERRDLLARELRKEKEKLRCMKNEVRQMQASFAERPNPQLLPKLKAEIVKLRAECERLTAAVDLYSDNQNNLPLGETNEEFYRNIYTGQRLQREGSWSCHVCTFRNHPLLSVCEECEMPRFSLGTSTSDVASRLSVFSNNNTSFCTAGGTSTSASLITAPLQER